MNSHICMCLEVMHTTGSTSHSTNDYFSAVNEQYMMGWQTSIKWQVVVLGWTCYECHDAAHVWTTCVCVCEGNMLGQCVLVRSVGVSVQIGANERCFLGEWAILGGICVGLGPEVSFASYFFFVNGMWQAEFGRSIFQSVHSLICIHEHLYTV